MSAHVAAKAAANWWTEALADEESYVPRGESCLFNEGTGRAFFLNSQKQVKKFRRCLTEMIKCSLEISTLAIISNSDGYLDPCLTSSAHNAGFEIEVSDLPPDTTMWILEDRVVVRQNDRKETIWSTETSGHESA